MLFHRIRPQNICGQEQEILENRQAFPEVKCKIYIVPAGIDESKSVLIFFLQKISSAIVINVNTISTFSPTTIQDFVYLFPSRFQSVKHNRQYLHQQSRGQNLI